MPDSNIKKVIIKKSDLYQVGDVYELNHNIRYRVISEDRNRYSHWSPITTLNIDPTSSEVGFIVSDTSTYIPYNFEVDIAKHLINLSWTMPALQIVNPTEAEVALQQEQAAISVFDVYVQWKTATVNSNWIWMGQSSGSSFSISYPYASGSPDMARFRVQRYTLIKKEFDLATYLITDFKDLDWYNNKGDIWQKYHYQKEGNL